jgi:PAS domain-containing protein
VADTAFLTGGGKAGALMREYDWAASPLGSPQGWPQPLKTLAGVMLGSSQPMFVAWGPERTLLYNDGYAEILVGKHPAALGRDFLDVWREIRADLVPIVEEAYAGRPVQMDDIELRMERRGYSEETHFAFSYTPVRDEAGEVAGFLCPCVETTGQVLAARRRAFRLTLEERLRDSPTPTRSWGRP